WLWGRIHTLTLRADLFAAAGDQEYDNGPYATPGGIGTVNVAHPIDDLKDDYRHRAGASIRLACAVNPGDVRCTFELPGGQRHFFDNEPHYDDLLGHWLRNQPQPLISDIEEVREFSEETILLESAP